MEAGEWTTQLRRGVLEFCILQILHYRPSYGYEIVSRLESLGPLAAGEAGKGAVKLRSVAAPKAGISSCFSTLAPPPEMRRRCT